MPRVGSASDMHYIKRNVTDGMEMEEITPSDCAWIMSNAFLILTMQSGFGLLEAGFVSTKNMANIMVKNVVDVCMGGIVYWCFGYGLSFGKPSTWFCGLGDFFAHETDEHRMGTFYTRYVFQFSFATAATTVVSGAVAERMKLSAYMLFSMLNVFVYVFPASWVWNTNGFLKAWGFHDFAGSCVVHLTGGTSALVATIMLGPRLQRFTKDGNDLYRMSSPVTALTGTFMLWWAWLAFNCGSTFAIDGYWWKVAAKVGINTLNGSIGGGITGIAMTLIMTRGQVYDISVMITGVLAGLVGVTAGCGVFSPFDSLLVGCMGSLTAILINPLLVHFKIDDPVGAVGVHFGAAFLGTVAVGLFGHNDFDQLNGQIGLLDGGTGFQLLIQTAGAFIVMAWSAILTVVVFYVIRFTIGDRVTPEHEMLGADWCEHNVRQTTFAQRLELAFLRVSEKVKETDSTDIDHMIQNLLVQMMNMVGREESGFRPTMPAARRTHSEMMEELSIVKHEIHQRHSTPPVVLNHNVAVIHESQSSSNQSGFVNPAFSKTEETNVNNNSPDRTSNQVNGPNANSKVAPVDGVDPVDPVDPIPAKNGMEIESISETNEEPELIGTVREGTPEILQIRNVRQLNAIPEDYPGRSGTPQGAAKVWPKPTTVDLGHANSDSVYP